MGNVGNNPDYVIVGAGIIGVSIAYFLKKFQPQSKIIVIEKETNPGLHTSGRNSGILHAGFYYPSDSLKAKFTRLGNEALTDFCEVMKIPINKCGKLVITKNEEDEVTLLTLFQRARANGVEVDEVTPNEVEKLEPLAKTYRHALWSPRTSSVDPKQVLAVLVREAIKLGVNFEFNCAFKNRIQDGILTSRGKLSYGHFINASGLYADKVAHAFGFSSNLRILPFKGLYLISSQNLGLRRHIYPVPNLQNPFLGVHFTLTCDGYTKIGPTAIPALWREQYGAFSGFNLFEAFQVIRDELTLFTSAGFDFKSLAQQELQKYRKKILLEESMKLLKGINLHVRDWQWSKPGIRAQLFNKKTRKLESDFIIEGDSNSTHILNAVSPAFTSSFPFANHVINQLHCRKDPEE